MNGMLFDTLGPPEDQPKRKCRRPRPVATVAAETPCKPPPAVIEDAIRRTQHATCYRCEAQFHEVLDVDGGLSLCECMFCGAMEWVRLPSDDDKAWRFHRGNHAGKTIEEAWLADSQYVEWAARKHPAEAVRNACRSWLDSFLATP